MYWGYNEKTNAQTQTKFFIVVILQHNNKLFIRKCQLRVDKSHIAWLILQYSLDWFFFCHFMILYSDYLYWFYCLISNTAVFFFRTDLETICKKMNEDGDNKMRLQLLKDFITSLVLLTLDVLSKSKDSKLIN